MSAGPPVRSAVVGIKGTTLGDDERRLFADLPPFGFILFARNVVDRDQLGRLTADLREACGRPEAPVLIDQEGGRVMRLRPPEWRPLPSARRVGELGRGDRALGREAAWLVARLIAHDLREVGIDVDCAPVLDILDPATHDVIGDRAYGDEPDIVTDLGGAAIEGFIAGGVLPAIKHMPGHGRTRVDSHHSLPVVDAPLADLETFDFVPFRAHADAAFGLTAHIVFTAIDARRPATMSPIVINDIIRGAIGFDGVLLTDDLNMQALEGDIAGRAVRALEAGCDIALQCSGRLDDTRAVLSAVPTLAGAARERTERGLARRGNPGDFDAPAGQRRLDDLMDAA